MAAGAYTSSIDTGLPNTPDLADIQTPQKLAMTFIEMFNAMQILGQAIDAYTGNTPAGPDTSAQPAESTVLIGNTTNFWCNASTALPAGYLVTIFNVSGVTNAKLANAASGYSGTAMGLTMAAADINTPVQVMLIGLFNFGSGVTPGTMYYLSDAVAGGIAAAAPSTAGHLVQPVGFGIDTESVFINPSLNNNLFTAPATAFPIPYNGGGQP